MADDKDAIILQQLNEDSVFIIEKRILNSILCTRMYIVGKFYRKRKFTEMADPTIQVRISQIRSEWRWTPWVWNSDRDGLLCSADYLLHWERNDGTTKVSSHPEIKRRKETYGNYVVLFSRWCRVGSWRIADRHANRQRIINERKEESESHGSLWNKEGKIMKYNYRLLIVVSKR